MELAPRLQVATLLRRYKRFLADLETPDGRRFTAHCPNTGAMTGCAEPGSEAWYSVSDNAKRKYPETLEVVVSPKGRIGVHSARANALVAEALDEGKLLALAGYQSRRREAASPDGTSRFDLLLQKGDQPDAFVEVKSVTLCEAEGIGYFPDAVSERARKHVAGLAELTQRGYRGVLVFCVQHTGVQEVRPAAHIDRAYAEALADAVSAGVEVYAYGCRIERDCLAIDGPVPFSLPALDSA